MNLQASNVARMQAYLRMRNFTSTEERAQMMLKDDITRILMEQWWEEEVEGRLNEQLTGNTNDR